MEEKILKDCILSLLRGAFAFITYILFIGIADFMLYICTNFIPSLVNVTINRYIILSFSVLLLFAYYNVVCAFYLLSKPKYASNDTAKNTVITIIKSPFFWIEYLPKLCFLVFLPVSVYFSILISFFSELNINANIAVFSTVLKTVAIIFSLGTEITAAVKAYKTQSNGRIKAFFKKILYSMRFVVMYPITCTLILVILFSLYNMMYVSETRNAFIKIFLAIIIIFALIEISHYSRALKLRRKFYKQLKKICDEKKAVLSEIYRPYLSLISLGDKQSFTLKYNGKNYDCQMLFIKRKGDSVYISESGEMEIKHTMLLGKYGPQSRLLKDNLTYVTSLNFGWENNDTNTQKILITVPVSAKMFAGDVKRNTLIDVGEKIGKYTVYNAKGFINAIDRDCIR
ncbi:MAG: hypothetical protein E7574_04860 [Ruminococcaceae bacterium]|nr:hypothetical protein [Oscillospiraceae bacterium]